MEDTNAKGITDDDIKEAFINTVLSTISFRDAIRFLETTLVKYAEEKYGDLTEEEKDKLKDQILHNDSTNKQDS